MLMLTALVIPFAIVMVACGNNNRNNDVAVPPVPAHVGKYAGPEWSEMEYRKDDVTAEFENVKITVYEYWHVGGGGDYGDVFISFSWTGLYDLLGIADGSMESTKSDSNYEYLFKFDEFPDYDYSIIYFAGAGDGTLFINLGEHIYELWFVGGNDFCSLTRVTQNENVISIDAFENFEITIYEREGGHDGFFVSFSFKGLYDYFGIADGKIESTEVVQDTYFFLIPFGEIRFWAGAEIYLYIEHQGNSYRLEIAMKTNNRAPEFAFKHTVGEEDELYKGGYVLELKGDGTATLTFAVTVLYADLTDGYTITGTYTVGDDNIIISWDFFEGGENDDEQWIWTGTFDANGNIVFILDGDPMLFTKVVA